MTNLHRINLSRVWNVTFAESESSSRIDLADLKRCETDCELSRRFNRPTGIEAGSSVTIQLENFPEQAEFILNGAVVAAAGDHGLRSIGVAERLQSSNLLAVRLAAKTEFCQPLSVCLEIADD